MCSAIESPQMLAYLPLIVYPYYTPAIPFGFCCRARGVGGLPLRRRCHPIHAFPPISTLTIAIIHRLSSAHLSPLILSPLPTAAPFIPASRPTYPSHAMPIPRHYPSLLSPSPQGLGRCRPARDASNAGVAHAVCSISNYICCCRCVYSLELYSRVDLSYFMIRSRR